MPNLSRPRLTDSVHSSPNRWPQRQQGGTLEVANVVNGAAFTVTLPVTKEWWAEDHPLAESNRKRKAKGILKYKVDGDRAEGQGSAEHAGTDGPTGPVRRRSESNADTGGAAARASGDFAALLQQVKSPLADSSAAISSSSELGGAAGAPVSLFIPAGLSISGTGTDAAAFDRVAAAVPSARATGGRRGGGSVISMRPSTTRLSEDSSSAASAGATAEFEQRVRVVLCEPDALTRRTLVLMLLLAGVRAAPQKRNRPSTRHCAPPASAELKRPYKRVPSASRCHSMAQLSTEEEQQLTDVCFFCASCRRPPDLALPPAQAEVEAEAPQTSEEVLTLLANDIFDYDAVMIDASMSGGREALQQIDFAKAGLLLPALVLMESQRESGGEEASHSDNGRPSSSANAMNTLVGGAAEVSLLSTQQQQQQAAAATLQVMTKPLAQADINGFIQCVRVTPKQQRRGSAAGGAAHPRSRPSPPPGGGGRRASSGATSLRQQQPRPGCAGIGAENLPTCITIDADDDPAANDSGGWRRRLSGGGSRTASTAAAPSPTPLPLAFPASASPSSSRYGSKLPPRPWISAPRSSPEQQPPAEPPATRTGSPPIPWLRPPPAWSLSPAPASSSRSASRKSDSGVLMPPPLAGAPGRSSPQQQQKLPLAAPALAPGAAASPTNSNNSDSRTSSPSFFSTDRGMSTGIAGRRQQSSAGQQHTDAADVQQTPARPFAGAATNALPQDSPGPGEHENLVQVIFSQDQRVEGLF